MNNAPHKGSRPSEALYDATRIAAEIAGAGSGSDPFTAAVRATRMPISFSDPRLPDNPVVFANDAFCQLTGYSRAEVLGRNCRFLQGAGTDPATVAKIREAVRANESIEIDVRNHRKGGEAFWNRLLIAPVFDANGDVAYFFASQIDVTLERERLVGLESQNAALTVEMAGRMREQADGEADMSFAAEAGRLGVWKLDLVTRELTTSAICRENFGRDPRQPFPYDDMLASIHNDDRRRVVAAFDASIATGADCDFECRILRRGGATSWVVLRARLLRGEDARPLRMAGICIDVSESREGDARRAALLELGDRLRQMTEVAEMSFIAAEILGSTLGVSRAGYGVIDPVRETITIERDWNMPGIESLAGVLRFRDYGSYIDKLKRGETVAIADVRLDSSSKAGASALEAISARAFINMPIHEADGFVALLYLNHEAPREWAPGDLAFVRDVADRTQAAIERRHAEQALADLAASLERQVEERTRERDRTWHNSQDLLAVVGPDGTFLAANPAWTTLLGWKTAEIVGRDHADLSHPDDKAASRGAYHQARAEPLGNYENRVRHKDGGYRWFSWVASPVGDTVYASGRHVSAEKEANDALQAAQDQLRQAQKMEAVGQLTGGLAHDFNNLLTAIAGSLEMLEIRVKQGRAGEIDKYVATAQGAAKRAAALTHRLLAFSRRQTLDPRPTDVARLVVGMADLIRRTVGPEITVETVNMTGLWTALVDPNQLENALLNLCINARDAMPDGGRLTIETGNKWMDDRAARERDVPPGQYLSLCVSDTGTGMTPEVVARAFDPFFTTKPLGMGTGLGLSMIYGFARQSNGQVRIYSEVGDGTMICIYLPRHYGLEEAADIPAGIVNPTPEAGETVLVVDDEPAVRMLVTDVLTDLGYAAVEAKDGPDGLKVLQSEQRIDLLITDVGLPGGMNGRQVADAARTLRPNLKVLFITGYAENAVVGNGHLDPGMAVLTKPFAVNDLILRIRTLIDA